jgi:hypothetical protein
LGRRKKGWNVASALSIADLQKLVEAKLASVEKLASRRAELAAELDEIDAELAAAGGVVKRGPGRPRTVGGRGPGRPPKNGRRRGPGRPKGSRNKPKPGGKRGRKAGPKGQSPLHNLIRDALKTAGEPMKAGAIAEKVVAAGYATKSKSFPLIVGQRLKEIPTTSSSSIVQRWSPRPWTSRGNSRSCASSAWWSSPTRRRPRRFGGFFRRSRATRAEDSSGP